MVFLSHRGKDKDFVLKIAKYLIQYNIPYWLDEEQIRAGDDFIKKCEEGIAGSESFVLFIGEDGKTGGWAEDELKLAITHKKKVSEYRIIPLLMPGAPEEVHIPWMAFRKYIDMRSGRIDGEIEQLIWSITGKHPDSIKKKYKNVFGHRQDDEKDSRITIQQSSEREIEDAIKYLASRYMANRLTFFVGTKDSQDEEGLPPGPRRIAWSLLSAAGLQDERETTESELWPTVDYAGFYYSLRHDVIGLEQKVRDLTIGQLNRIPQAYRNLAKILNLSPRYRRGRDLNLPVIVSTNFDLLLECALLQEGVPFSRVIQFRKGDELQFEHYPNTEKLQIPSDVWMSRGDDRLIDWLERQSTDVEVIEFDAETELQKALKCLYMVDPKKSKTDAGSQSRALLYKIHGSVDVHDSCAISAEQYLQLLKHRRHKQLIPHQIESIVENADALILGYELLEPDFRLTYTMLSESFENREIRNYALATRPPTPLGRIWKYIKSTALRVMNVNILECDEAYFLSRLEEEIEKRSSR